MATVEAALGKELSIGEVAELTGLSVHALRFYEREGLLLSQHVPRGTGGHRRFDPDEVHWLRICSKLRASGMPLAEIGRLAELVREGPGNEDERLELLRAQKRRVERQLADLGDCLRVISRKVGVYERQLSGDGAEDLLAVGRRMPAPSAASSRGPLSGSATSRP
jgi:DNA-binding transcriptional MerR regulator